MQPNDEGLNPFSAVKIDRDLLTDFQNQTSSRSHDKDYPYLHPRLLSFTNASSKKYWTSQGLERAAERDTFSRLWMDQTGIKTRIGVFATWTRTHVGSGIPLEDQVWRCWGAALVHNSSGRGKHLYIFDCDGDMEAIDFQAVRPRDIFIGAQQNLLEAVKKKFSLQSLWYLGCNGCLDRSLSSTGKWAISIANTPDASFHQDDPRFKGFKQVMRLA